MVSPDLTPSDSSDASACSPLGVGSSFGGKPALTVHHCRLAFQPGMPEESALKERRTFERMQAARVRVAGGEGELVQGCVLVELDAL